MAEPDLNSAADHEAVQFMILDFLGEILKFSASPGEMAQFLVRQLREVFGARVVVLLLHGADLQRQPPQILALEPARAHTPGLDEGLARLLQLHPEPRGAVLLQAGAAEHADTATLGALGVASASLTPLRVGDLRVGTLVALDHLNLHRSDDCVRLLSVLSPVFALILRNTAHFEAQEAKVVALAEEYRAVLQANLDGYLVVDASGQALEANDAYLAMSGHSPEEIPRLHVADLEALEDRAGIAERIARMRRQGSDRFLTILRRKDGSRYPVEVSATFVPGREVVIAFIRDLTERMAAERALRDSEAHHRELVEILGEGVAISDPQETILQANPEADRIFGTAPNGLVGRSLQGFLAGPDWQRLRDHTPRRADGLADSYQVQIRRPDGDQRTLQVTATPRRDEEGRFSGTLFVFRDATEEIKAQEALRLAQKMESLGNLAGGLAHDMNNVLGAIMGLASAHLELQPEGSRLHATFETINKACLRGRNMVKSLLDFARKDVAGQRPVALNALAKEEVTLLETTIPAQIKLVLDLDPLAGTILGDHDALSLALMNLCVNSLDAMPDGGELRLVTARVSVDLVSLTVSDTGAGMTREVLERAVEPFFTTKPHGKGTGLGLALAYRTVKAHQGNLEIRSQPGLGTAIELRFPRYGGEDERPGQEAPATDCSTRPRNILLVDDDELIHASVGSQLEVMGHRTTMVECGEAALRRLQEGFRPDLIILDMNMPGLGGSGTLTELRTFLPEVPVILSTGRADQQALDLARAHPRVTILPKPSDFHELKAILEQLLGH